MHGDNYIYDIDVKRPTFVPISIVDLTQSGVVFAIKIHN